MISLRGQKTNCGPHVPSLLSIKWEISPYFAASLDYLLIFYAQARKVP